MNWLKRDCCTVCRSSKLDFLLKTPRLPVFQGCVDTPETDDLSLSQEWVGCPVCGTIQLAFLLPLNIVYGMGHAESFGKLWDSHHADFSRFIHKHSNGAICEVGGGVGKLADSFLRHGGELRWYNLDPNPGSKDHIASYQAIKGFFDQGFSIPNDVNTLVFSHCLEHMYDFSSMIELLSNKLQDFDRLIVSWPIIEGWLVDGLPGALNWEHTFFLNVETLKVIFSAYGFKVIDEKFFNQNHSIFIALEKTPNTKLDLAKVDWGGCYLQNCRVVSNYFNGFAKKVLLLKKMLVDKPKPLWFMPASIYSQYLYAFGLFELTFKGILDNSENKNNLRLYGTPYYVKKPSSIAIDEAGSIVLNGGAHSAEIMVLLEQSNPNMTVINI